MEEVTGILPDEDRMMLLLVLGEQGVPGFSGFVQLCTKLLGWDEGRVRELLAMNQDRGMLQAEIPEIGAAPVIG